MEGMSLGRKIQSLAPWLAPHTSYHEIRETRSFIHLTDDMFSQELHLYDIQGDVIEPNVEMQVQELSKA